MNRRGFLELLFGATAAALVLPAAEIAWPAEVESMLVTPAWVVAETGRQYVNSLRFVANFDRSYDAAFHLPVGDTIRVRLPEAFA